MLVLVCLIVSVSAFTASAARAGSALFMVGDAKVTIGTRGSPLPSPRHETKRLLELNFDELKVEGAAEIS
jgi:hypothetical protein